MSNLLNLALLYGGKSGEHEISLRSAAAVFKHLNRDRFNCILIGIARNGVWYVQPEPSVEDEKTERLKVRDDPRRQVILVPGDGLYEKEKRMKIDIIFPVLHGAYGEDGCYQGLLETIDVPYAGSGVLGSALGMDKIKLKEVWQQRGLPVIPFVGLKKSVYCNAGFSVDRFLDDIFSCFGNTIFVKPACAGSSLGVHRAETREEAAAAMEDAFRYDSKILIERAIKGRELECAVLGGGDPEVTPPGEIIPSRAFYDYEAKYVDPDGARLCIPADLPKETTVKIRELVKQAYRGSEAYGFARVDLFLEEETENIYLNEINTIPGFTNISMFPLLFTHAGYSYSGLIDRILDLALEAQTEKRSLKRSYTPPG